MRPRGNAVPGGPERAASPRGSHRGDRGLGPASRGGGGRRNTRVASEEPQGTGRYPSPTGMLVTKGTGATPSGEGQGPPTTHWGWR